MRLRAPKPSERVIIAAFFDELRIEREPTVNVGENAARRGRNMIYSDVARRTGVTYERVVDLCHNRLYTHEGQGEYHHGWKMGTV